MGEDYEIPEVKSVVFTGLETFHCINVAIIPDEVIEESETFDIVLSTEKQRVIFTPGFANITILDTSSKYHRH